MDSLRNTYYLFRHIIEKFFHYLHDTILHEIEWISSGFENFESQETRSRQTIFTHPVADFAASFVICIFLGICVLLFSKPTKDEDELLLVDASNRVNLPEDQTYKLPPTTLNTIGLRAASGDASSDVTCPFIPNQTDEPEYLSRSSSPSGSQYCELHIAHSQSTQTTNRGFRRAAGVHQWLIRRTRSGQVYGKYPM